MAGGGRRWPVPVVPVAGRLPAPVAGRLPAPVAGTQKKCIMQHTDTLEALNAKDFESMECEGSRF